MGADFLYMLAPLCELTPQRRRILAKMVVNLHANFKAKIAPNIDFGWFADRHGIKDVKELIKTIENRWPRRYLGNRDTGVLEKDGIVYLITGGMSWGDPPTDTYEDLDFFNDLGPIYDQMIEFAKEDAKKQ